MPIQAQYSIRHLRRHEIEQLLQLCKAEGRHMGTACEVQSWMQIDPTGFFVAVNQEGRTLLNGLEGETELLLLFLCFMTVYINVSHC